LVVSAPLQGGEALELAPRSHTERTYDISAFVTAYAPDYEGLRLRPTQENNLVSRAWTDGPFDRWAAECEPEDLIVIFGDYGNPVWWMPTERRLFTLLLVVGTACLAGASLLWRRHAYRSASLCIGLAFGLLWAWGLMAYGVNAIVKAFIVARPQGPRPGALVVIGAILLLVPIGAGIAAFTTRKQRSRPGVWLAWIPWILLPLLAFGTNWVVQGIHMFV
jgi:hypothetical protein